MPRSPTDAARIEVERPPIVLVLPWNLADEIAAQLEAARDWGARLVVAVPTLRDLW